MRETLPPHRPRVAYYTHTAFFEIALSLVDELSRLADVHLIMEVAPDAWRSAGFDMAPASLRAGLVAADEVLRSAFPAGVRARWQRAVSFHLAVHHTRRSLHPSSFLVSRRVLRFVERLAPGALHVDDVDVSPRLPLALPALPRTIPLVITSHDPEPHSGERNWRKRLARRLAYPRASAFVLHHERSRLAFCAAHHLAPHSAHVVRLAPFDIFREWEPAVRPRDAPTVLFFGRLSPYKGVDVLYHAAPAVAQAVPGVRFVTAGRSIAGFEAPKPPPLGHGASVEVIDRYVSNRELAGLLREARVVVCPYRDATQSGVVLTAFGFDRPVVATAVGGLPEYVVHERTGLLVPPGDPDALSAALTRVLTDDALHERLVRGIGEARRDSGGWAGVAATLLDLYQSLGPRSSVRETPAG